MATGRGGKSKIEVQEENVFEFNPEPASAPTGVNPAVGYEPVVTQPAAVQSPDNPMQAEVEKFRYDPHDEALARALLDYFFNDLLKQQKFSKEVSGNINEKLSDFPRTEILADGSYVEDYYANLFNKFLTLQKANPNRSILENLNAFIQQMLSAKGPHPSMHFYFKNEKNKLEYHGPFIMCALICQNARGYLELLNAYNAERELNGQAPTSPVRVPNVAAVPKSAAVLAQAALLKRRVMQDQAEQKNQMQARKEQIVKAANKRLAEAKFERVSPNTTPPITPPRASSGSSSPSSSPISLSSSTSSSGSTASIHKDIIEAARKAGAQEFAVTAAPDGAVTVTFKLPSPVATPTPSPEKTSPLVGAGLLSQRNVRKAVGVATTAAAIASETAQSAKDKAKEVGEFFADVASEFFGFRRK